MKKLIQAKDYLLLIDEEAEIKENTNTFKEGINGDWYWNSKYNFVSNNGDITAFDFKIIAYYPLTKEAKELDLPELPPFEVDIEKLALKELGYENDLDITNEAWEDVNTFIEGYKAAQSKQFSLEDMKKALSEAFKAQQEGYNITTDEIIQSLSTQQLPKEFIPDYDIVHTDHAPNGFEKLLKFKTNSEGKEEIQGTYKY